MPGSRFAEQVLETPVLIPVTDNSLRRLDLRKLNRIDILAESMYNPPEL